MQRTLAAVLSAVTSVAALGLAGCGAAAPPPAPSERAMRVGPSSAAPTVAPLPPPDQLTAVIYRLADTSLPADQKVALVQYGTTDEQPTLANFGEALRDGGFVPLAVTATDEVWAGDPGHVVATVTIGAADPGVQPFTFPMEFAPVREGWQLSRRSADQLLPLVTGTTPPTPTG